MNKQTFRAFLGLLTLATLIASGGCVSQRPSRNGVFNENQYIRKDFLIQPGSATGQDPGWMLKATVTSISTPNPLGDAFNIFAGAENGGNLVRFQVTQDKLLMLDMREMTSVPSDARTAAVNNAWPITNVDLKYRVNLDGEKTNFYEENQELDWQVRQWVKLQLDKNDLSDIAPLGAGTIANLAKCTDSGSSTATLVPDSFLVDESHQYMEWTVQVITPLVFTDTTCQSMFGLLGEEYLQLGRTSVTFNLKYSMVRAVEKPTYVPLNVAEKDGIRHKYGAIETIAWNRDESTGLLAANEFVDRFDPTKPIVWYFAEGFPAQYKAFFTGPNGIKDQTNAILKTAGAKATVDFQEFDANLDWNQPPRQYGDVRYSFLRWVSDRDQQSQWAGVTQFVTDPRTGESISSSISFNDFAIKDYYVQRIDAYLTTVGASLGINSTGEWGPPGSNEPCMGKTDCTNPGEACLIPTGMTTGQCRLTSMSCTTGDTVPLINAEILKNHNGQSSLYQKMQLYLQKPPSQYGNLGPQDFIVNHDNDNNDFFNAYYALAPYYVFADPNMNPFVIPEGQAGVLNPNAIWQAWQAESNFQAMTAVVESGQEPFDSTDVWAATKWLADWKSATLGHLDYKYKRNFMRGNMHLDTPDAFSFEQVVAKDGRKCVAGQWETKQQWIDTLISTYWSQTIWHEFGHSLGLEHNFMASVDATNFPTDPVTKKPTLFASSVMEYNVSPDRIFWNAGWAPYDAAAIAWIYANNGPPTAMLGTSISNQLDSKNPWNDPLGFDSTGKVERQFLYCNERHELYTPLCKPGDMGRTPSEIIANAIDDYEWQYAWRNYRVYEKLWDDSHYADGPTGLIADMRKFQSMWIFDWSTGELGDTMRRIGIKNPDPNGSDLEYFTQLTNKFNQDISTANQIVASFHKAVINQSAGERPYKTIYDKFFGDVTQQGIIIDKLQAMQSWTALWPTTNYDQNQAGAYVASYALGEDASYQYISEDTVNSMIGGAYDAYPYFTPLAVAQFAQATHQAEFVGSGRPSIRNWIGGWVFYREQDFLDYFREIAIANNLPQCAGLQLAACTYDPRPLSDSHNEFFGPDHQKWIWAYIADRNTFVAVQKEFNISSYVILRAYTDDVIYQLDDGQYPGGAYGAQWPVKYFLDSYTQYN